MLNLSELVAQHLSQRYLPHRGIPLETHWLGQNLLPTEGGHCKVFLARVGDDREA